MVELKAWEVTGGPENLESVVEVVQLAAGVGCRHLIELN